MHAFLSKIFGRKKDEKKDEETSPTTLSPTQLLDGKFEAVSPTVSPSASKFLELDQASNERDKTSAGATRPTSSAGKSSKLDTLPHLSLNFGETRTDGFLLDDELQGLSDSLIGERRLNPLEALILIRSCSQAITAHGLETLGLMHPHWYSSSPEIQRKLISQFLHSQSVKNANDNTTTTFDSPIESTRSMHDIAAVLRWGLRHLQLDGDSFGTDAGWYKTFLDAEAAAEYPPKAFSEKLAPMIPIAHLELLTTTLELFSSLAAHSEANSTSGSKLSKLFGIWLLTARQIEEKDDWFSFYARWERTGRQLEHLFLARIRDTNEDQRMPVRLLELVRKYPYTQGLSSPQTDLQLLPRPRFSTPIYDALFVRIEIEFPPSARKPKTKMHPLNLLADAFATKVTTGEYAELWTKITAASKNGDTPSPLSNIFADETIRFLSFIPDSNTGKEVKSPAFSLLQSPSSPSARSFASVEADVQAATQPSTSHKRFATEPITPLTASAPGNNWEQFSSSGFLDSNPAIAPLVATLFDQDIEKTAPPEPSAALSRKSSRRVKAISRKSVDLSRTPPKDVAYFPAPTEAGPNEINPVVKAARLEIIQFDEAFVDFWTDSLLDPITAKWPNFIICKFKSTLVPDLTYGTPSDEDQQQKQLKWLVLEQVYTNAKPPPPITLPTPDPTPTTSPVEQARAVSPTPSTRRRFNFWSMSRSTSSTSTGSANGKKKAPTGKVNEMGELVEEDSAEQVKNKYVAQTTKAEPSKKTVGRVPVPAQEAEDSSAVPVAAAAAAVVATAIASTAIASDIVTTAPTEEDKTPMQEVTGPVPEELSPPEAAADATVAVFEPVHAETDPQVAAETISNAPAAGSEFTAAPTELASVTPAEDVAAPETHEPEIPAPSTEPMREAVVPTIEAKAVPLAVESEVTPKAMEAASAPAESIHAPAVETVPVVEAPPVAEEVSAVPSYDTETASTPVVETGAEIPVVEAVQAEAIPVVETEVVPTIEEPEVAPAPVVEPAGSPIVGAVSTVKAAAVIEEALPAPAIEADSAAAPIDETETATPVLNTEETSTVLTAGQEATPAIDSTSTEATRSAIETNVLHAVEAPVVAPVEDDTPTASSTPEEAELEDAPVSEAETEQVPLAAAVEMDAPTSHIADIASTGELDAVPPTAAAKQSMNDVDSQTEEATELSALEASAVASIAAEATLSTIEAKGATSPDDVDISPAHAEVQSGVSAEPFPVLAVNYGEATPIDPKTDIAPAGEPEASSADFAVEEETDLEPAAAAAPGFISSPAQRDGASAVDDAAFVSESTIHPTVQAEGERSLSFEIEAAVSPAVEAELAVPVIEDKEAPAVNEIISDVTDNENEVIPHAVTEEDLTLPAKENVDVPSVVEESVPSAIADEFVSPPQDDIPSVEQETPTPPAGSKDAAEHTEGSSEANSISLVNVQASPTIIDVGDSPAAGVETPPSNDADTESIVASSNIDDPAASAFDAHPPTVEPASVPLAEATEMDVVPPPVESVTSTEASPIEVESEVAQPADLIPMSDLEVTHVAAESMLAIPSVESTAPGHAQADPVESASESAPLHAAEKPIEQAHQEVAAFDAPGVERPVSSAIVEAEHVDGAPLALARDHAVIASHESTSAAVDEADAFPQPQIEQDRSAVVDELAISGQVGASEQFINAESVLNPISDGPAPANEDKEFQAHTVVAEPEDVEEKEEQSVESPIPDTVLEQVVTPASAELATEAAVEVNASDPVLPPGLCPTLAQVLPEAFPVSEVVLSAEPAALAADSQEGAVVPPKVEEHSEGGATDDQHTSEIRSATHTDELSTGESAAGESISTISPPSTSPNESFAPTVIAQEAPDLDVTTALNDPVSALSAEASLDTTETTPTVTIPTKDDDADFTTIADASLSRSVGINLVDGQTGRASNLEHSAMSAFESQEASTGDFALVTAPSVSLVDSALSEPIVIRDTAESVLADSAPVEPAISLSDEHITKSAETVQAENVSDSVVALATPSELGAEENKQFHETAAALAAPLADEPIDTPAESNALDTSSATIIPTEADNISEIVASQPAIDIDEAGSATEIKGEPTAEADAEAITALTKPQDVAVFGEVVAPQPPAEHEIKHLAEVAVPEGAEAGAELASAFVDAPTGEEPVALQSEQEVIQGSAVADAALDIPLNEARVNAPLADESVSDAHVDQPVAAAIVEPEAPIESAESPVPEEKSVAAPEPAFMAEESLLDATPGQIIGNTTEPLETNAASEGSAAPADLESEVEPVAPSEAPVVFTEMTAETSKKTSHIIQEKEQAPEVDAHIAEESLVEDSLVDVSAPAAPSMVETEAEHALEASELVASVETAGPAAPADETSRDIVEETPIVEDATPVVEPSENLHADMPAANPPVPVVDEATATDEETYASVEVSVHSKFIVLPDNEEPAPPLENPATEDAPAAAEDGETSAKLTAVRIEPSANAELSVEEANNVETLEAKPVEDATQAPAAEGPAEPLEFIPPVDDSIVPVKPAPAEELPNVQVIEVGPLSTEQSTSSSVDVEVAAEAETIHPPPADTGVDAGNAHLFSSAEPEATPAGAVVEALPEESAQEPEPDALLATSASEVLPTQEEVNVVEESATPAEDVTLPLEPSPETVQEHVLTEEPAELDEGNIDQVAATAAAEPDEHENVPPAITNDLSQPFEPTFSESVTTEPTNLDDVPAKMSAAPIELATSSQDIPASEEVVGDDVVVERAVEHGDSNVPEEATEQEDEAVGASVQEAEAAPVEDVFAAPKLSSNFVEPEAEAAIMPDPAVEHDLSDEPVAEDPPVTEDALVVEAAAAEEPPEELAQETPAPEGIPVHEESTSVEETSVSAEAPSPAMDPSTKKKVVEAQPEKNVEEATNSEVDSIETQQDTNAMGHAAAHSDESTPPIESSSNIDGATMTNESVSQEEAAPIEVLLEKVEIPAVEEPSIREEVVAPIDESDAKSIDVSNDSAAEQAPSEESAVPAGVGPEGTVEAEKEKSESAEFNGAEAGTVEHIAHTESTIDVPENNEDRAVMADSEEPDVVDEVRVHTDAITESAEIATPEPPRQAAPDEADLVQDVYARVEENDVQPPEEAEITPTTEDIPTHTREALSEQSIAAAEPTAEGDTIPTTPAAHYTETEETAPLIDSIPEPLQAATESTAEPDDKVASTSRAETPSSEEDSQLPIVDASPQGPGHDEPNGLAHETAAVAEPSALESVEEAAPHGISPEGPIEGAVAAPAPEAPTPSAENVIEEVAEQPLAEDVTGSAPTANGESVDITTTNSLEQEKEDIEVHQATQAPVEEDNSVQPAAAMLEDGIAPVEHLAIPEFEGTTIEHAPEEEAADSGFSLAAAHAEPAEAGSAHAEMLEEDKIPNTEPPATAEVEAEAFNESAADVEERSTTEPTPAAMVENDVVKPSGVEDEAPSGTASSHIVEHEVVPTDTTNEQTSDGPDGPVVAREIAAGEDVAVSNTIESTMEHAPEAEPSDTGATFDAEPAQASQAEALQSEAAVFALTNEEVAAALPTAVHAQEEEVSESSAAQDDIAAVTSDSPVANEIAPVESQPLTIADDSMPEEAGDAHVNFDVEPSVPEAAVAEEAEQDEDAVEQHEHAATAEPEAYLSEEVAPAPVGPETAAIAEDEEVAPKDRDTVPEAAHVTTEHVLEAETVDVGNAVDAEVGAAEAADTPPFDQETQNSAVDEPVIADNVDVIMGDTAALAPPALSVEGEAATEAAVPATPTVEEEQVERIASELEVANAATAEVTEVPVQTEVPTEAAETPVALDEQSIADQEDVAPSTEAGEVSLDPAPTAELEKEQPIIEPPALETTAEPTEVQARPEDTAAVEAPPEAAEHLSADTEAAVEPNAATVVKDSILPAEAAIVLDHTSEPNINDTDTTAAAESDQVDESSTHEPVSVEVVPATAEPAAASEETAIHPLAAPAMQNDEVGPVESTSVSEGPQEVVGGSGVSATEDQESKESTQGPPAPEPVEVLHADTNEQEPHFLSDEHRETQDNIEAALVTEVSEPADEQPAEHSLSKASATEALASCDVSIPAVATESALAQEAEEAPDPALATESEVALEAVPAPVEAEADVEGEPTVEPTVISVAQEEGSTNYQDVAPLADPEAEEVLESAAITDTADLIQQEHEAEPVAPCHVDEDVTAPSEVSGSQGESVGEGEGTTIAAAVVEEVSPEVPPTAEPESQENVDLVSEEAVKEPHWPAPAFPAESDVVIETPYLSDVTDIKATTAPAEEVSVLSTHVEALTRDPPAAVDSFALKPDGVAGADETERDVLQDKVVEDDTAVHEEPTVAVLVEETVDATVTAPEPAVELSEPSASFQEPVVHTAPLSAPDAAPLDEDHAHIALEAETTAADAPVVEDFGATEQVQEVAAAAEDADESTSVQEPSAEAPVIDTSAHEPVAMTSEAEAEHFPELSEPAAAEVPAEPAAPTVLVDEAPYEILEAPAIEEDVASKQESAEAELETAADLPSAYVLDSSSPLDEQGLTAAEETVQPSFALHSREEAAAPLQSVTLADASPPAEDTQERMEAATLPVEQTLENDNQPGVSEEQLVEKTSTETPVAGPVVDSGAVLEAGSESEHLAENADAPIAAEEHVAPVEPAPETESVEGEAVDILVEGAEASPAVDVAPSLEVEPEVQAEALSKATANGNFSVGSIDTAQDSDVLIGNENVHQTQSDKSDADHDKSESVVLPDKPDIVDNESLLEVTAAANGNGHVKTETDATLVEPTSVPSGEDSKLETTFAHADDEKPVATHAPAADNSAIQDDSVLPTESVLTKVEELLATAGSALDMESIAKSLPLATITHDDPDTKLTTTAANGGDEEQ